MNYTLHQLNIFLKIVEVKSITKAAELLFLTQPAVSIQLKNLQNQFEIPLTEVIGRQLYVTAFGEEIAEASRRIVNEVDLIKHKSLAYKGFLTGTLTIAIVSTGKYVMPYFLSGFFQKHKGIDLNMDVTNKYSVLQSLERNEVDFALVSVLPENLQVETIPLMDNKLYLVGNTAQAEALIAAEQEPKKLPLIYREQGSATRQAMERYVADKNIEVSKYMQLTSNEAVKQAVIAGLGFSIMPLIGLKNELNDNEVRIIPRDGLPMVTCWHLIWLKGKQFSPAAKAYLEFLNQEKQSIMERSFKWHEAF